MTPTMGMPLYHEDKAMFAYDYVSLKNQEYNKKAVQVNIFYFFCMFLRKWWYILYTAF